jgi:hypothetical protein
VVLQKKTEVAWGGRLGLDGEAGTRVACARADGNEQLTCGKRRQQRGVPTAAAEAEQARRAAVMQKGH